MDVSDDNFCESEESKVIATTVMNATGDEDDELGCRWRRTAEQKQNGQYGQLRQSRTGATLPVAEGSSGQLGTYCMSGGLSRYRL